MGRASSPPAGPPSPRLWRVELEACPTGSGERDRVSVIWEQVRPERFWHEILPASELGTGEYRLEEVSA